MPFKSQKQRSYFHYLKSQGKMDQATIDKWESHTPKGKLPERVGKKDMKKEASFFWQGFSKKAVENYVSTKQENKAPDAPEKMLKWNEKGGVDPRTPEEMASAQAVNLITLPPEITGASCASCSFFRSLDGKLGHGFCTNPSVKMDVSENMLCMNWSNPSSHSAVEQASEESQAMAGADMTQQIASTPQQGVPSKDMVQSQAPAGANMSQPPKSTTSGQSMAQMMQDSAEQNSSPIPSEQYQESPVANQSGFPQQQGAMGNNPLAEQAVEDFQGGGSVAGPTGADAPQTQPKEKTEPKKKQKTSSEGKSKSTKDHTININIGKEKTASADFWKGLVDGY